MMNRMTGGRPLMTDHLQDLELELQLLKRKRQMIQQQEMDNRQRHYIQPFNQPLGQNSNYSEFYSDEPSGSQFGHKRQPNVWEEPFPPKRFCGPQDRPNPMPGNRMRNDNRFRNSGNDPNKRMNARNYQPPSNRPNNMRRNDQGRAPPKGNTRMEPAPRRPQQHPGPHQLAVNHPRPLMDLKSVRPNLRQNFKAKPQPRPQNKFNSYPQAQIKSYVDKTTQRIEPPGSNILKANKPPTKLMSGRLELALGQVMKQIKDQFESDQKYSKSFRLNHHLKAMKEAVRQRLRQAMLDKPVDVVANVLKSYRAAFPANTDREIVELCLKLENVSKVLGETVKPREYYSINMRQVVSTKLDEMFGKLQKLYTEENAETSKKIDASTDAEVNESTDALNETVNSTNDSTITSEVKEVDTSITENNTSSVNNDISKVQENETVNKDEGQENVEAENPEPKTNEEEKTDEADEKNKADDTVKEELNTSNNEDKEVGNIDAKTLDRQLNKLLPEILPKYKKVIMNILRTDRQYRLAAYTVANEALRIKAETTDSKTVKSPVKKEHEAKEKGHLSPLHYVKIFGRPALPLRNMMQAFLDKYEPKCIKKHKGVKNLLFVGFADKTKQEEIMRCNKITIGNCCLTIKVSENVVRQSGTPKKEPKEPATEKTDKNESINDSANDDNLVPPDLDNQIDDLLASIRSNDESIKENDAETSNDNIKADDNNQSENNDSKTEIQENKLETVPETEEIEKSEETLNGNNDNVDINDKASPVQSNGDSEAVDTIPDPVKGTPTRASSRLANATPRTISTRRSSKLGQ